MREHISYIISNFPQLLANGGYWILGLIVILEGLPVIGSIFPGHVAIISAGFLAKLGILNLGWVIVISIIMAVLGDVIGFMLGRKHGYPVLQKVGQYFFIKNEYIEKTKKLIDTHTGKAIILGKFSPMTRSLVPFLVGASGVEVKKFWIYNFIGSTCWVVSSIFIGYIFGASYHLAAKYLGKMIVVAIISTILIIWGYKVVNLRFHVFKKYELFILGLNILSLWTLAKTIQDRLSLNPFLVNFDKTINLFMQKHVTHFWEDLALFISNVGGLEVTLALGLIIGLFFLLHNKWRRAAIIFLSMASALFISTDMKEIFMSPRPFNALKILGDPSFPSSHATMAAAFFVSFAYIFAPKIKSWVKREILIVGCVLAIILVGISRIILNVHWASDVIAGWSLGVFLATGSILLVRYVGAFFFRKHY